MLDTRTLIAFVTVAEESSFTRAAHRLCVAQPALTKQIKRIEDELGLQLFRRTKRSVRLTPDGTQLVDGARIALDACQSVAVKAEQLRRHISGHLRIGFTPTSAHVVLPPLIRRFRTRHPQVECELVELSSGEQINAIENGSLDAGILRPAADRSDVVHFKQLVRESLVVLIPRDHRLAGRTSLSLASLRSEIFVAISKTTAPLLFEEVLSACRSQGFTPEIGHEATQLHAVASLVAAGCGVAVLPASARHIRLNDLLYKPLRHKSLQTVIAIAWSRVQTHRTVEALIETAGEVRFGRG